MSYYADESDVYRDPYAWTPNPRVLAIVREYEDARAALLTIKPGMDRTQRWMTLDRFYQARMAMGLERDAANDTASAPIIAAILAEQAQRGVA